MRTLGAFLAGMLVSGVATYAYTTHAQNEREQAQSVQRQIVQQQHDEALRAQITADVRQQTMAADRKEVADQAKAALALKMKAHFSTINIVRHILLPNEVTGTGELHQGDSIHVFDWRATGCYPKNVGGSSPARFLDPAHTRLAVVLENNNTGTMGECALAVNMRN